MFLPRRKTDETKTEERTNIMKKKKGHTNEEERNVREFRES